MLGAMTPMDCLHGRTTPLFWACTGFFETLAAGGIDADSQVKRLCARIDIQLARMRDGSASVAEGLLRDVLYYVATSTVVTATVKALREHYALSEYMQESAALPGDPVNALAVLSRLRSAWEECVTAEIPGLEPLRADLLQLDCGGNDPARSIARTLTEVMESLAQHSDTKVPAEVGVAVAKLLLVAEEYVGAEIAARERIGSLVAWAVDNVRATLAGAPSADAPAAIASSGAENLHDALAPVCTEVIAAIKRIEHALTAYAAEPAQTAEAQNALALLAQLAATLNFVQLEDAAGIAQHSCEVIEGWIACAGAHIERELPGIAEALAAIEIYMQGVLGRRQDAAAVLDKVLDRFGIAHSQAPAAARQSVPAPMTVEQELRQERLQTQNIFNEWRDLHETTLQKLKRNLRTVHDDARLIADRDVEHSSAAALAVVHKLHAKATGDLAPAIDALRQGSDTTPPAATAEFDVGSDREILEVFLEEGTEVLQTIADNLQSLRGNPERPEEFATVRRAFHTLKGSSRVVGLTRMGDVAWRFEELLNLWLADRKPPTAELLDLLEAARSRFASWLATLRSESAVAIRAEDLMTEIARIKAGGSAAAATPEPALAAAVAIAAPAGTATMASPPQPMIETVTLGEAITVSRTLYEIFLQEAATHIATMRQELTPAAEQSPVCHASLRAAHTLGGIARTVGVGALAELSYALEQLLQPRHDATVPLSAPEGLLVTGTLDRLQSMLDVVRQRALPDPDEELIAQLIDARSSTVVSSTDAGTASEPAPALSLPAAIDTADLAVIDPELRATFSDEAYELAAALARATHDWRAEPHIPEHAEEVARHLHTLKGSARSAGAMSIGERVHDMETRVLGAVHADRVDRDLLDGLQAAFDQWCEVFERVRHDTQTNIAASAVAAAAESADGRERGGEEPKSGTAGAAQLRVQVETLERLLDGSAEFALSRMRVDSELAAARRSAADIEERVRHLRNQLREIEIQSESQMHARFDGIDRTDAAFDPLEFDRYTRLQELTRLMAESLHDLTTVQHNLVRHFDEAGAVLSHQGRVQRALHADLMHIRTTAFNSISERLQRIARRTALELNREVELSISGGQVELDRALLEKLQAPLEHMIRNAIAHGIKAAHERQSSGKIPGGSIRIVVRQEANSTVIVVSDDGAGLDLSRIRQRAEEVGLLGAAEPIDEDALRQLIFRAGFSTAEQLTEVSGRGVGLDIVHNTVVAMGGHIKVDSQPGLGTTFTLTLPLTLAVTRAVVVRNGDYLYGIPSTLIVQVQRCNDQQLQEMYAQGATEWAGEVYSFRYLGDLLATAPQGAVQKRNNIVVLLRAGDERLAVHVDDLLLNQELALKEMGPQLAAVPGIAGATVGSNGRPLLILNPLQIAARHAQRPFTAQFVATGAVGSAAPLVLVVDDSVTVRKVTGRLLERAGYRVATAKDGVEALERIGEEPPVAVLLDIEMPRMDGFELTQHLRAESSTRDLPIIMISSRTAEKHRLHALDVGVNVFLGKPFNDEMLLRHLQRLTNSPETSRRSVA